MHDAKASHDEPRVPDGAPYCHLQANMQAVTVVYLNCFVTEFLMYLDGLWHLCPAPDSAAALQPEDKMQTPRRSQSGPLQSASSGLRQSSSAAQQHSAHARKAQDTRKRTLQTLSMAILLDVEMQAPVIEMPRDSRSPDSLELDLGALRLTNRVILLRGDTHAVDLIDITMQDVRICTLLQRVLPAAMLSSA